MSKLSITIGNKNYSSWSLRGWLALKQTGAAFDEVVVPLDLPESKDRLHAAGPSGRVPVLQDGALIVWDSLAIGECLAERFPESGLWPSDIVARAVAVGARLAVAAYGAKDDAHVQCTYRRIADSKSVDDARAKTLHDNLGVSGEAIEDLNTLALLEV